MGCCVFTQSEATSELSTVNRAVAMPASEAGFAERYGRGKTSHTIHVWWARRPHSAMELLVKEVFARVGENSKPSVLDLFGGGGTIPIEIARAGGRASSIDCNPLSTFIQRTSLEWSQEAFHAIGKARTLAVLDEAGRRILRQLTIETAPFFPLRANATTAQSPFAYFWSYKHACRECGFAFRLSKRPWISKKRGKNVHFASHLDRAKGSEAVRITENLEESPVSNWGRRGEALCPVCSAPHQSPSIKDATDIMDAVAYVNSGRPGKYFAEAPARAVPSNRALARAEQDLIARLGTVLPTVPLPKWSGIVNPSLYGIDTYADIFNARQRVVLLHLLCLLADEIRNLEVVHGKDVARFVGAALSGLIDQLVDWNCRLSMWIAQNEQVGRAFCGPGVPMLWDYVESDPAAVGPANLWNKLTRIVAGVESLEIFAHPPRVVRGLAQNLPFADATFDAVITDPPYYDNIYYNVLADFFFVWKRMVFAGLLPELFAAESTEDQSELVASTFRQGTPLAAHEWYTAQMGKALAEAGRVLKPGGKLALVYSHSSVGGWEAILTALRTSDMTIEDVLPLNVERKARPRAIASNAVNTCVVFMASSIRRKPMTMSQEYLDAIIKNKALPLIECLRREGWDEADIGIAALAECIANVANVDYIAGVTDHDAVVYIASIIRNTLPGFRIQVRDSL